MSFEGCQKNCTISSTITLRRKNCSALFWYPFFCLTMLNYITLNYECDGRIFHVSVLFRLAFFFCPTYIRPRYEFLYEQFTESIRRNFKKKKLFFDLYCMWRYIFLDLNVNFYKIFVHVLFENTKKLSFTVTRTKKCFWHKSIRKDLYVKAVVDIIHHLKMFTFHKNVRTSSFARKHTERMKLIIRKRWNSNYHLISTNLKYVKERSESWKNTHEIFS